MTTSQGEATTTESTPRRRRPGTRSRRATTGTWLHRRPIWRTRRSALSGSSRASGSSTSRPGTGGLSLPAARLGAQVLATDWSPAMIERFEARVREEGLTNAEGRVMDCHALDLPDDSFDVTGSQFGVMLVPDQPRALREMVRVTKPGGRVLVIAYGSPAELEFLQFFIGALKAVAPEFPGLPDDPPPLEFQVADPEVLRRRLTDAGLKDVRVERTAERPTFRSGQEMWDWVLYGNPIPGMWSQISARTSERDYVRSSTACSASAPGGMGEPYSRTRSTSASARSDALVRARGMHRLARQGSLARFVAVLMRVLDPGAGATRGPHCSAELCSHRQSVMFMRFPASLASEWPREESNLRAQVRSLPLYPLSYGA